MYIYIYTFAIFCFMFAILLPYMQRQRDRERGTSRLPSLTSSGPAYFQPFLPWTSQDSPALAPRQPTRNNKQGTYIYIYT